MDIKLSSRGIAKLVSFFLAISAVLAVISYQNYLKSEQLQMQLNYSYTLAITELTTSADSITSTLSKTLYSGTPEMLEKLSTQLWRDASIAKSALSQLPVSDLQLEQTNRFLSQIGNYALSISKRTSNGEELSLEDYAKLATLYDFSKTLSQELWSLEKKVQSGMVSLLPSAIAMSNEATSSPPSVFEGFSSLEEGFSNYPTLIYDGPFSDHILEKTPELTKNLAEVDENTALNKASECSGIAPESLTLSCDEDGKMPSYCFISEDTAIAITKQGGFISYMLKTRNVNEKNIEAKDAVLIAEDYLLKLGITDMKSTYYETLDNICTINFACYLDETVIYTDLIKVSVALDDGEIMGIDSRGYIVNHREREKFPTVMTSETARQKLSPLLNVEKESRALVPTSGENETYTFEFLCTDRQGKKVLVYINPLTGAEEQILILLETPDGILTV